HRRCDPVAGTGCRFWTEVTSGHPAAAPTAALTRRGTWPSWHLLEGFSAREELTDLKLSRLLALDPQYGVDPYDSEMIRLPHDPGPLGQREYRMARLARPLLDQWPLGRLVVTPDGMSERHVESRCVQKSDFVGIHATGRADVAS